MESWAVEPPGRSGDTSAPQWSRCPTAVLAGSALDNRVLPSLRLGSGISSSLKPRGNFVQLGALRARRLGAIGNQTRLRFLGSSLKFKLPLLTRLFPDPTAAPGLRRSSLGVAGSGTEDRRGLRAPARREPGRLLPLRSERPAGVSTADSASVPQPAGGRLQAAGSRHRGPGSSPGAAVLPRPSFPPLPPESPPPHPDAGAVAETASRRGADAAEQEQEEESRAGGGTQGHQSRRISAPCCSGFCAAPARPPEGREPGYTRVQWRARRVEARQGEWRALEHPRKASSAPPRRGKPAGWCAQPPVLLCPAEPSLAGVVKLCSEERPRY